MSPIEAAATLFGLVNVTLVVRRSIWNYPFGLAMVSLYAWVFAEQKLYSDTLLQFFFFVVQIYGWWNWIRVREQSGEVVVESMSWRARSHWAAGCLIAAGLWGLLMHRFTDAAFPWWDGTIAMLSVAAQVLQSRRYWESWVLWVTVDLLGVPLFLVKGLWLTAGLYTVFLALALWGLVDWLQARRRSA